MICQRDDHKGGVLLLHFTQVQTTVGPLLYGLSKGWPQRRGCTAALHTGTDYSRTSLLRSVKGWPQRRGSSAALHTGTDYSRTSLLRSVKGMTAKEGVLLLHFTQVQSTAGPLFYDLSKGWSQRRGSSAALHTGTDYSRTSLLRSVKGWPQRRGSSAALHTGTDYSRTSLLRSVKRLTAKERFYCCTSHRYRLQ